MESAILHNIRCLSVSVVYKCRRIPSYDLKYSLTSLSSKVDREYSYIFISCKTFPEILGSWLDQVTMGLTTYTIEDLRPINLCLCTDQNGLALDQRVSESRHFILAPDSVSNYRRCKCHRSICDLETQQGM